MRLELREIASPDAVELYLTATPDPSADPAGEAQRMFDAIAKEASRRQGRVFHQRVFAPEGCLETYRQAWQASDGQGPKSGAGNWLHAGAGAPGGIQAHVVAGLKEWTPLLDSSGAPAGWACRNGTMRWAAIGGVCLPRSADEAETARAAFQAGERLLAQAEMGLGDVARTWCFMEGMLGWYGQFNKGRNDVFRQRGLLGGPAAGAPAAPRGGPSVPASTGVGAAPAAGRLAVEFFASAGKQGCIERRQSAGRQKSAYDYGSAFARASQAITPAGRTVFVSGTAAIDDAGRSCFLGDAPAQIRMTLDCVQAVLADMQCAPRDVVQAIAYCKTPAVAAEFTQRFQSTIPWPWVVVVCDICRDDLLFEVEATAGLPTAPHAPASA
jgi:enamine deaminase RidA (YjgF/YER057c/UK114 family)